MKATDDINLTHALLNPLNSGYQGNYVFFNILSKLQGEDKYKSDLVASKAALDKIGRWMPEMWKGVALLSFKGEAAVESAEEALELFHNLKENYKNKAARAAEILRDAALADVDDCCFLSACLGLHAYSREHYIQGLVKYGEVFDLEEVADRWRQQLISCQEEIACAHYFLGRLMERDKLNQNFHFELYNDALLMPFILRSRVNDMNVVSGLYAGQTTYASVGISEEDGAIWEKMGFQPEAAGEWAAFDLAPYEAADWIYSGFGEPGWIAAWRARGFNPQSALLWINAGYRPRDAALCVSLGYSTPEAAAVLRQQQ